MLKIQQYLYKCLTTIKFYFQLHFYNFLFLILICNYYNHTPKLKDFFFFICKALLSKNKLMLDNFDNSTHILKHEKFSLQQKRKRNNYSIFFMHLL